MFPGTTLFGAALVLIIVVSLIILLIRKPHIPLLDFPSKEKGKGKEEVQTVPKPCPHYLGYLGEFPKNTPIPQECRSCPKIVECQVGSDKPSTLFREEEGPEEEPSEPVEAPKPQAIPPRSVQERPPECSHFFGYLRKIPKNTPIPDECFGCPKMVDCLYYDAASE